MDDADPRVVRTRRKVLVAAAELLREIGFAGVTIEQVSERSGVARSTMYRHWSTREEILRDAFSLVAVPHAADAAGNLRDELRGYLLSFADGLEHAWGRAAATLALTAFDDPAQRAVIATFTTGYARDVGVLLDRATARGEPLTPYDAADVADRLVAPLFHRYLFRHLPLDGAFVSATADHVADDLGRDHRSG